MSISRVTAASGPQRPGTQVRRLACVLALPIGLAAWASSARANDPGDAAARVPPVVYVSPLPGAAAAAPERVGSWRDANDVTGRIGGWRAYAREAQGRGSSAASAGAASVNAAPAAASAPSVAPRAAPAASSSAAPASPHKH